MFVKLTEAGKVQGTERNRELFFAAGEIMLFGELAIPTAGVGAFVTLRNGRDYLVVQDPVSIWWALQPPPPPRD